MATKKKPKPKPGPYQASPPSIKGQGVPPPAQLPPGAAIPSPQPFDPAAEQARLQATLNVGLSGAETGYQRGLTAYDTGYDPTGARNHANPYSQAQLLEDNYHRSQAGTRNSMAAVGQYNSGAYGRAAARDDRVYAQGSDALQRGAAETYHGLGVGQLQTYGQNSTGVSAETLAALRRAIYGS
jgi:hypothetical protein